MTALIHAELLKLRTTRAFWGIVAAALAFVPAAVALAITQAQQPLSSATGVRNVISAASSGTVLLLVVGILITAGEFRHNTATATFLVSPHRGRVLGAKLAAASIAGTCLAAATSALTLAVAVPWLAARHVSVSSFTPDIAAGVAGAFAAAVLSAVVGVGFGALVRNQTTAITVALLWSQIVETLLVNFTPTVGRWSPGGAANALTGVATAHGGLLPLWAAAALLSGYSLFFALTGIQSIRRRDIA
jgi:ABC-2 type transport system permease protein